jgi:iron complex transport system ATP-binding protein
MTDLYRLESVSYSYGSHPAVQGICTLIGESEVVGLIGPNGAGKSTLIKLLGGLLRGWRGDIHFQGASLHQWNRRAIAKQVAYVPQQTQIAFPYTAREVVLMGRLPHQDGAFFETARDRDQVDRALALADCSHLADRPFGALSGGERQLVVLASALAQEPRVLLLDEPTVFLDLKHQLTIQRVLSELHRGRGVTLVIATHDLNMAAAFCSRVLAIKDGRLLSALSRSGANDVLTFEADLIERLFDVQAVSEQSGGHERIVVSWGTGRR